ncbi:MAG: hypothetical protein GEV28_37195 [Actinophytocola sp.]|nr:hypothetical protein [Actinophytocola sp.]
MSAEGMRQTRCTEAKRDAKSQWKPPVACPQCGRPWDTSTQMWRCTTPTCSLVSMLAYAASRDVWNIDGLGEEIATALVEAGLVTNLADLFDLTADRIALARYPGSTRDQAGPTSSRVIGSTIAQELVAGIAAAKALPLARHITALGIRMTGRRIGGTLASHFRTLDNLRTATLEELTAVDGIGGAKARAIHAGLRTNTEILDRLDRRRHHHRGRAAAHRRHYGYYGYASSTPTANPRTRSSTPLARSSPPSSTGSTRSDRCQWSRSWPCSSPAGYCSPATAPTPSDLISRRAPRDDRVPEQLLAGRETATAIAARRRAVARHHRDLPLGHATLGELALDHIAHPTTDPLPTNLFGDTQAEQLGIAVTLLTPARHSTPPHTRRTPRHDAQGHRVAPPARSSVHLTSPCGQDDGLRVTQVNGWTRPAGVRCSSERVSIRLKCGAKIWASSVGL